MKIKPPKMTEQQKLRQNQGSRFIHVIPAPDYWAWLAKPKSERYQYDEMGRRVK